MHVSPEFIAEQDRGSFAATMRGATKRAMSLSFPLGYILAMERQSTEQSQKLRDAIRERFAVPIEDVARPVAGVEADAASVDDESSTESDTQSDDLNNPDVAPSNQL